jgi:hypothetical protein
VVIQNALLMDVQSLETGRYIFIRFNPDHYYINGVKRNPTWKTRLERLKEEVEKQIKRIESNENKDLLEIEVLI